jgi:hypothetical protein
VHLVRRLGQELVRQRLSGDDAMPTRVSLERAYGRYDDGSVRGLAGDPALEVEEPLRSHVGAEAGLGDEEVAAAQPDSVGDDRRVARGDVAERPGVDEYGRVFERLEDVGLDGLAEQHGHRSGRVELFGRHGLAVAGVADHDPADPLAEVPKVASQRQRGHHLGRRGDVEAGLARHPVAAAAETHDDVAEGPVVDVEDPSPGDVVEVEPERVVAVEVVVEHGTQQVVRRRDGMHVAGEVQVEHLHRHDLAVAAAGRAAFDAERRPHRRLPDGDRRPLAEVAEALSDSDGGRGLALAERCGSDRADHDVLRPRPVGEPLDGVELHLEDVLAVPFEQVALETHDVGDVLDRLQRRRPGDLEVTGEGHAISAPLRCVSPIMIAYYAIRRPRRPRSIPNIEQ